MSPLALTDEEMDAVMQAAAPIEPAHRDAFLRDIAAELAKCPAEELGPGSVFRIVRDVQRRHFTPLRTWDAIGKRS
jgi:hypothetical protein